MKVLLVRMSSMGDLVHTLYALEDMGKQENNIELHWLSEPAFGDIASLHPLTKKVVYFPWRKYRKNIFKVKTWKEVIAFFRVLRSEHYDRVIDSQGLIKSAVVGFLSGAPVYGFAPDSAREKGASLFYKYQYSINEQDNVIWKNRMLFAAIFDYRNKIDRATYDAGIKIDEKNLPFKVERYFHMAVMGASRSYKLWREDNWKYLLQERHQQDGLSVYLTWGNDKERKAAESFAAQLGFVKVLPRLRLKEIAVLLSLSRSLVAVDTGLLHLANALNLPTVGIYPKTSVNNTRTEGRDYQRIVGGEAALSPQLVSQEWKKALAYKLREINDENIGSN